MIIEIYSKYLDPKQFIRKKTFTLIMLALLLEKIYGKNSSLMKQ